MENYNGDILLVFDGDLDSLFTTALSSQESIVNDTFASNPEMGISKQTKKNTDEARKFPLNILKTFNDSWITTKMTQPQKLPTPKAYGFMHIYDMKKKLLVNQQQENERKLREFRALPMPNFGLAHQLQNNRRVIHRVTVPITPNVLRTSLQAEQKRQQQIRQQAKEKEEELKKMLKPNFKAQPMPKAYKMEPLKTSNRPSMFNMKPFNLKSEERGRQRKLFDEQNTKILEDKNRRMEEERKKRESEVYQKIRQLTNFKAKMNPFAPFQK